MTDDRPTIDQEATIEDPSMSARNYGNDDKGKNVTDIGVQTAAVMHNLLALIVARMKEDKRSSRELAELTGLDRDTIHDMRTGVTKHPALDTYVALTLLYDMKLMCSQPF